MPKGHGYRLERYKGYLIVRQPNDRIDIYHGNVKIFDSNSRYFDSISGAKSFLDGYTRGVKTRYSFRPRWIREEYG